MNKIFSLLISLFIIHSLAAQTISPSTSTEFCPNVNTTFTVTIPGYQPNIYGFTNNPIIVSTNYPPVN